MNWLNTKYMIRAGVLTMLLLFPSLLSATCKPDTIIRNYKPDSLKLAIKADSIIAFHEGDSAFTIVKADTVLPYIAEPVLRTGYDRRVHRFRKNWERIIPTHSKIQYAGNMGLLSFGTGWDYGKRNQWETDLLLGFIPKYSHISIVSCLTGIFLISISKPFPVHLPSSQRAASMPPSETGIFIRVLYFPAILNAVSVFKMFSNKTASFIMSL